MLHLAARKSEEKKRKRHLVIQKKKEKKEKKRSIKRTVNEILRKCSDKKNWWLQD